MGSTPSISQNWRFHIPLQVDVGVSFSEITSTDQFKISQSPTLSAQIQSGMSLLYRKRIQFSLTGGGFLNSFNFHHEQIEYSVAHIGLRAGSSLAYISKPINKAGSRLHIGSSFGISLLGGEESHTRTDGAMRTVATSFGPNRLFISPEIGLSQLFENGAMDLALCYFRHLTDDYTIQFQFTKDDLSANASTYEGYFGLRVRYHFRVRQTEQKKPVQPLSPQLADTFEKRKNRAYQEQFETKQSIVKLKLFDRVQEDGDSISVMVNDSVILSYYEVKNQKRTLHVPLKVGTNTIKVFAHNEGRVAPNTASAVLIMGLKRKQIPISTSLRRNQSFVIERRK